MKKYIALALLTSSLFAQNQFIEKCDIGLNIQTNKTILNKITNLNKEVKNNKKCKITENIKYTKNDKYPYNVVLDVSCDSKNNKDIEKIKNMITNIVNSKDVKIEEYSTKNYQLSEEKYKNEKDFLDKHKDVIKLLNKGLIIQQQMEKNIKKDFEEMQKLFN